MKNKTKVAVLFTAFMMCFPMLAQDNDKGPYAGLTAGWFNPSGYCDDIERYDSAADVAYDCKASAFAARFFGGYKFNDYASVEGGFLKSTDIKVNDTAYSGPPSAQNRTITSKNTTKVDFFAWDISGKVEYPLHENIIGFGRIGYTNLKVTGSDSTGSASADGNGFLLGIGGKYNILQNFSIGGEYSRYFVDVESAGVETNVDSNFFSAFAEYRF